MYSRIASLALSLCLALSTEVRAQGKATSKEAKPAPTLEQRLALLEEQAAKMLAEIKAIRGELKNEAANRDVIANFSVYRLKNIDSTQMAKLLTELLSLNRENKSLRIVADAQTNSVLVAGKREDQEIIAAIISRLEDSASDAAPPKKDKR